jgi:phage regulator Rha-like protein
MNILTQNTKTMSSREIAELTGKQHGHVVRDIELLNETLIEESLSIIGESFYTADNGQVYREFLLTQAQTIDLMTGYNRNLRVRINRRWAELEAQASSPVVALPDFTNPALAARAWADEYQAKQIAQEQLELAAPKVSAYDKLIESTHLKSVGDVAKSIGLRSAQALNKKLEAVRAYDGRCGNRVWSGWFVEQGLGEMRTTDEGYSSNKMTAKGQAWALNLFGGK